MVGEDRLLIDNSLLQLFLCNVPCILQDRASKIRLVKSSSLEVCTGQISS